MVLVFDTMIEQMLGKLNAEQKIDLIGTVARKG